jgi:hypothetical protein
LSAGLLRFGDVALGCGRTSVEVDRLASSSVASGVETGAVGLLPTTGFLPPQPIVNSAQITHAKYKLNLSVEILEVWPVA